MNVRTRKFINTILLASTILFIGSYIYKSIDTIKDYSYEINYFYLILAFLSVTLAQFLASVIWFRIATSFNLKAPFRKTVRIWLLSRFGRYIPGKIPFLLLRINLYKNTPASSITLATITEYIASVTSALLTVIIALSITPILSISIPYFAMFSVILLLLLLLHPKVLKVLSNKLLVVLKMNPITTFPEYKVILSCVAAYMLPILFNGLGLFFLFNSMEHVNFSFYPTIAGVYYASSLVGLIALFAPGGVGVREGLMMVSFSLFLNEPIVIIASISIRFITLLAEAVLLLFFCCTRNTDGFHRKQKRIYSKYFGRNKV